MKKFLKIAGILLAILIWGYVLLWGYVKLILQKDAEVTLSYLADHIFNKEECIKDFDEVHEIVVDVFPFFEEKGIDPKALYHKFSKRVQNINSIYDYYDVLEEYFASLKVSSQRGRRFSEFQPVP